MKHLLALLMAVMMVLTVVGCDSGLPGTDDGNDFGYNNGFVDKENKEETEEENKKETEEENKEETKEELTAQTEELVVGKWVGVSGGNGDVEMTPDEAASFVLEVKKDGSLTISVAGEGISVEYEVKPGQLVITKPEELQFTAELKADNILHIENLWDLGITLDMEKQK